MWTFYLISRAKTCSCVFLYHQNYLKNYSTLEFYMDFFPVLAIAKWEMSILAYFTKVGCETYPSFWGNLWFEINLGAQIWNSNSEFVARSSKNSFIDKNFNARVYRSIKKIFGLNLDLKVLEWAMEREFGWKPIDQAANEVTCLSLIFLYIMIRVDQDFKPKYNYISLVILCFTVYLKNVHTFAIKVCW